MSRKNRCRYLVRNSQAIEVYSDLHKTYDKEVAKFRKSFYGLSYQITEECFREAQELKDEPTGLQVYEGKMELILLPKVEEWQREVLDQLRSFMASLPDPELGSIHLSSFEVDLKKKTAMWLESEKNNALVKIKSLCKKEKTAAMKRSEYKKKCLQEARTIAGALKESNETFIVDDSLIKDAFQNIFFTWLCEAQEDDQETFGQLDCLLPQIWNETFGYLREKLLLLRFRNEVELFRGINEFYSWLVDADENDPNFTNYKLSLRKILNVSLLFLIT